MPSSESPLERLAYRWCFLAVLAAAGLLVAEVAHTGGREGLQDLARMTGLSLVVLGKFVVFVGLHRDATAFSPWALALLVWIVDLLIGFALLSGLGTLERAPVLGRWLRRARLRAQLTLARYPGLERMAFLGVVAYVMLPLAATGAVTGSFAARIAGLSRIAGVVAIALGSFGTALVFALFAQFVGERAEEILRSPILAGLALATFLVALRLAWVRVTRRLRESP